MAERKKSPNKTKSSVRPTTAKPEGEVIDGASAEKMTGEGSVTSNNAATKSKNQASIATNRRWSLMLTSQTVTLVIAVIGVLVALLALSVSGIVYWQTADLASSGRPSTVTSDIDQGDLAHFRQRLDDLEALIKQNANNFESQQQRFANTTAAKGADMLAPSSMAVTSEIDVPDKTRLDDVIARLAALEAVRAKHSLVPAISDRSAEQNGLDKAQMGLLAAAGLLAENLAGRDLGIWIGVFDDLQWSGIDPTVRDTISMAAQSPVESRADLLSLGRMQLTSMLQSLNKVEDGSGLLEQVRARLAKLIQLRRTGGGSDRPETVLASFETALDNADFDAAFAAANRWSSSGLEGMDSWLAAAQRRHDLDLAVNQLVATLVQRAAGKS
jgi:uncharacterized membrane protein